MAYVYGSTYFKNYIELPNLNKVLIGYEKIDVGIGSIEGNVVTGINPTEILNKDNLVLNVKLDEFKYESRKINSLDESFLKGSIKSITLTTFAGNTAYNLELNVPDFVTNNDINLNDYLRLSGNNKYLKVINIVNENNIVVIGDIQGNLIGSSVFKFNFLRLDKEFRNNYTNKEFSIYSYSNNYNGLLQYDEYGNYLATSKRYIKSCSFLEGLNSGNGLLIHNSSKNKSCIIYNTFDDYTTEFIEGTYLIVQNEDIHYKINAFRKEINFSLEKFVVLDELSTNEVYEVQLNGIRLENGEDYDIIVSENKIVFKGNFLNNFSNNLNLILYSRNQDLKDSNIKIALEVEGYNEQYIEFDIEDYLKDMYYLKFMDGLTSGSSFIVKEIERSDKTMNYDKTLGSNNKATFKQLVASELIDSEENIITDNLLYFVGGYNKRFRLIRVDDQYKRIEYYNDCEIVDSIQKTSQVSGEEYNFTIKYKTREEFEFKSTDRLKKDNNNLVLLSNN